MILKLNNMAEYFYKKFLFHIACVVDGNSCLCVCDGVCVCVMVCVCVL